MSLWTSYYFEEDEKTFSQHTAPSQAGRLGPIGEARGTTNSTRATQAPAHQRHNSDV